ncbi:hypothetical protein C8R43DRAFT_1133608 [Mycena crocata]|nr:hypothetical protein C8R43DRAFT_1133608 [Mycena crocata]
MPIHHQICAAVAAVEQKINLAVFSWLLSIAFARLTSHPQMYPASVRAVIFRSGCDTGHFVSVPTFTPSPAFIGHADYTPWFTGPNNIDLATCSVYIDRLPGSVPLELENSFTVLFAAQAPVDPASINTLVERMIGRPGQHWQGNVLVVRHRGRTGVLEDVEDRDQTRVEYIAKRLSIIGHRFGANIVCRVVRDVVNSMDTPQ